MKNLADYIKQRIASNAAAAATTTVNGNVIDTLGFHGAMVSVHLGDVASGSVLGLKLQGSDSSDSTTMADISGASITSQTADATSADNKLLELDVYRHGKRYVMPVLTRGTATATLNSMIVTLYGPRVEPTTTHSDTLTRTTINPPG